MLFELVCLAVDRVNTPSHVKMLCCTNKMVRKYLTDHKVMQRILLPWLLSAERVRCELYRLLGSAADRLYVSSKIPLVVAPRRSGKTSLLVTMATTLLLNKLSVCIIKTCPRTGGKFMLNTIRSVRELAPGLAGQYVKNIQWRFEYGPHASVEVYTMRQPLDTSRVDVVLVDEAVYVCPEMVQALTQGDKPVFFISSPPHQQPEPNPFTLMCCNTAFNVVERSSTS
jgi:hypothetical protein